MNSITLLEMLLGVFQILALVWPVWVICSALVTPGVRRYCLDQPDRFGSDVYCIQQQAT